MALEEKRDWNMDIVDLAKRVDQLILLGKSVFGTRQRGELRELVS